MQKARKIFKETIWRDQKMIKLYKDRNKNNQIKEIIADLRNTEFPLSFKYYLLDEKIDLIKQKYDIPSWEMARKIT